ncbi:electron transport complex subunit RsxG [Lamprobacter modestohalophilus]|uniref:Ion-translocating oxidoreductase complex subunit G n=1 Tax=Lamprobacter modestohalophilus TaxID=1064514 RepID=A0A9X1B5J8_9GAMM|nr:electron transport complex subunit RsxG [Lamprobacter modestohalophilus]
MKKAPILIAAFILGSFAVGGVGLVAVTHELTDTKIAENQRAAMMAKLEAIVPEGRMSNDPLQDRIEVSDPSLLGAPVTEVYRVRDKDEPVALILKPVVPDGYAGPINLLVSVLHDGTLGGVRVISHHETPGLGDKIEERKDDWIIEQFNGRSLGEPPLELWQVKRDGGVFDQFTGATITPRSVVNAVKGTLLFVQQQGDALYTKPATGQADGNPAPAPVPAPIPAAAASGETSAQAQPEEASGLQAIQESAQGQGQEKARAEAEPRANAAVEAA